MTKKTIFIIIAIAVLVTYSIGSFTSLNLNPILWEERTRLLCAYITLPFCGLLFIGKMIYDLNCD